MKPKKPKETTMAPFLPNGFEKLKTEKAYWKMSEMKEGDNRLRIMTRPVCGWLDWQDKKPLRYAADQKPKPVDPLKPVRPFWACYVWDYARDGLYVLEITQSSVQKSLAAFGEDADWGDFTQYDIKIRKEGSGKDTRYVVTPLPHKPLTANMEAALAAKPIYLENLFFGGDPWNPDGVMDVVEDDHAEAETAESISPEQVQMLEDALTGEEALKLQMLKHYGIERTEQLPLVHYPKMIARAEKQRQGRTIGA
jgi:hypothetical protein